MVSTIVEIQCFITDCRKLLKKERLVYLDSWLNTYPDYLHKKVVYMVSTIIIMSETLFRYPLLPKVISIFCWRPYYYILHYFLGDSIISLMYGVCVCILCIYSHCGRRNIIENMYNITTAIDMLWTYIINSSKFTMR